MVATMREQDEAMLKSAFRRLDHNGDKFLTMDELIATLTKNEDSLHRIRKTEGFHNEVRQFIAQNDHDGNRKLDETEFVLAMKRFAVNEPISTDPDQDVEI